MVAPLRTTSSYSSCDRGPGGGPASTTFLPHPSRFRLPRCELAGKPSNYLPSADKFVLHLLNDNYQEPSEDPADVQAAQKQH
jgi:hypothetical protein